MFSVLLSTVPQGFRADLNVTQMNAVTEALVTVSKHHLGTQNTMSSSSWQYLLWLMVGAVLGVGVTVFVFTLIVLVHRYTNCEVFCFTKPNCGGQQQQSTNHTLEEYQENAEGAEGDQSLYMPLQTACEDVYDNIA